MKAYDPAWLEARHIRQQAHRWHRQGMLSDQQFAAIRQAYPNQFRDLNAALEIGAFVFTLLATLAGYALLSLMLRASSGLAGAVVAGLMAAGTFVLARSLVQSGSFYRNGTDNALWLVSALSAVWGATVLSHEAFNTFPPFWQVCLLAVPILLAYVVYTSDTILTAFLLLALYGGVFSYLLTPGWGKAALPFVLLGTSAGLFGAVLWLGRTRANALYYHDSFALVRWVTATVGAAAGNYLVVRELNGLLLENRPATAPEIALPGLFWLLTFGIPATYLGLGIRLRCRMGLILGAVGLALALATVRHYFATWPFSVSLVLDGIVICGLAVWLIRYLHIPRRGFTDALDDEPPLALLKHVGTLTALQGTANAQQPTGPRFGGGEFGGGGAGSSV